MLLPQATHPTSQVLPCLDKDREQSGPATGQDAKPRASSIDAERKCIASGTVMPKDQLLRCVLGPDGFVVPDLARKLPGRGLWVEAKPQALAEAIKKKAFSRAAKANVKVADTFEGQLIALYKAHVLQRLGLMRRSGHIELGFEKIKAKAIKAPDKNALWLASDATQASAQKLPLEIDRSLPLTSAELGSQLGRASTAFLLVNKHACDPALLRNLDHLGHFLPNSLLSEGEPQGSLQVESKPAMIRTVADGGQNSGTNVINAELMNSRASETHNPTD